MIKRQDNTKNNFSLDLVYYNILVYLPVFQSSIRIIVGYTFHHYHQTYYCNYLLHNTDMFAGRFLLVIFDQSHNIHPIAQYMVYMMLLFVLVPLHVII